MLELLPNRVCLLANSIQSSQLSYFVKKTIVSSFIATIITTIEILNKAQIGVHYIYIYISGQVTSGLLIELETLLKCFQRK